MHRQFQALLTPNQIARAVLLAGFAAAIAEWSEGRLDLASAMQSALAKSSPVQANSKRAIQNPALDQIEERLFFREYADEQEEMRLSRIEQQIFGESFSGNATERIARINAAMPESDKQQNSPAQPSPSLRAKPDMTMSSPYHAPQPDDSQSRDDAIEKERLSVMAAKQAEVDRLLAEGVQLWRSKQGPQAIEKFEQVVRLDPQNAQAFFSLGVAYEAKGAFPEAEQNYRTAAGLAPENKDYSEASKAIQKKLAAKQNIDAEQSQLRSLADSAAKAYQAGEFLSALDLYKQLDQKSPHQALVKWNIGTIYLRMKNPFQALPYYKEASKLKPDDQRYSQAVAQLEENLKREEVQEKQSEEAWAHSQPQANGPPRQQNPPARSNGPDGPGKLPDVLLSYGVSAKGGKEGARIVEVTQGSRGAQVGLQIGDVIKAVDGNVITNVSQINQLLLSKPPGQRFQFTVQRDKRLGQLVF